MLHKPITGATVTLPRPIHLHHIDMPLIALCCCTALIMLLKTHPNLFVCVVTFSYHQNRIQMRRRWPPLRRKLPSCRAYLSLPMMLLHSPTGFILFTQDDFPSQHLPVRICWGIFWCVIWFAQSVSISYSALWALVHYLVISLLCLNIYLEVIWKNYFAIRMYSFPYTPDLKWPRMQRLAWTGALN